MKFLFSISFVLSFTLLILPGCIDPTDIGSVILDGDLVGVGFTDTITLNTSTVEGDSVKTFGRLSELDGYLIGIFEDPFFGRSKATIYAQAGLVRSASGVFFAEHNFEDLVLDSVVLIVGLDSSYFYGNILDQDFEVKVSVLGENIDGTENQYSNATYSIADDALWDLSGSNIFTIRTVVDSILDYTTGSAIKLAFPHIRFVLPNAFGERFIQADTLVYENDSTFLEFFPGFQIEPVSVNEGMLSLDMLSSGTDAVAGLYLYTSPTVNNADTVQFRFPFNPFRMRTVTLENDYSTAAVKDYLDDSDIDSLFCVQGMEGLFGKVDFPYITENANLIVNRAELEISIASIPGHDYDTYPPVEQIIVSSMNEDGDLELIKDVLFSINTLDTQFGGTVIKGLDGAPDIYRLNLSTHLQDMIDGIEPSTLYITTHLRAINANQVALYGSGHPQYPIKLNLHFTER